MGHDVRCAVAGEGVIPLRMFMKVIDRLQVIQEDSNRRRSPIVHEKVDGANLRKVDTSRFPVDLVIGFGGVIEVPDVVNRDFAALNLRPRSLRDVW